MGILSGIKKGLDSVADQVDSAQDVLEKTSDVFSAGISSIPDTIEPFSKTTFAALAEPIDSIRTTEFKEGLGLQKLELALKEAVQQARNEGELLEIVKAVAVVTGAIGAAITVGPALTSGAALVALGVVLHSEVA